MQIYVVITRDGKTGHIDAIKTFTDPTKADNYYMLEWEKDSFNPKSMFECPLECFEEKERS